MPDRRSPHRARQASPPGQVTRSPATAAGRGRRGNQDAPAGHPALPSNGLPAIPGRSARPAPDTASMTEPLVSGDHERGRDVAVSLSVVNAGVRYRDRLVNPRVDPGHQPGLPSTG